MKRPVAFIASAFAIIAVLAVTVQLLGSRDAIHRQLESALTTTFETPVTIGKLYISLLPDALLTASQIRFTHHDRSSNLSVEAVKLDVSFSQIWRGEIVISELHLQNLTGSLAGLMEYISLISEPGEGGPPLDIALRRIVASPVLLLNRENRELGPYELVFQFGPEGGMVDVSISRLDQSAILNIVRGEPGSLIFGFTAQDWHIPYGPPLVFERVLATGTWLKDQNLLKIETLQASAYTGSMTGQIQLGWGKEWLLKGQVLLDNVDTGALLAALDRPGFSGNLSWDGKFKLRTPLPSMLLSKAELDGRLVMENGSIHMINGDNGRSNNAEALRFKKLEGRIRYKASQLEIQQLQVSAPSLSARRLGPYDIKLQTSESGALLSVSLVRRDDRLKLFVNSAEKGLNVKLRAQNWTLPAGPPIRIDQLELDGKTAGRNPGQAVRKLSDIFDRSAADARIK